MIFNDYLLNWWDHSLIGIRVCHWTISKQYQILPKYSPIFRILMTNNSKRKAKIATLNVPIPIPIELLQFLSKKGQYIVPNNIVDQYAHVWTCGILWIWTSIYASRVNTHKSSLLCHSYNEIMTVNCKQQWHNWQCSNRW